MKLLWAFEEAIAQEVETATASIVSGGLETMIEYARATARVQALLDAVAIAKRLENDEALDQAREPKEPEEF